MNQMDLAKEEVRQKSQLYARDRATCPGIHKARGRRPTSVRRRSKGNASLTKALPSRIRDHDLGWLQAVSAR